MTITKLYSSRASGLILDRSASDRWKAWDYQSTMLAAVERAGISLDDADTWYLP